MLTTAPQSFKRQLARGDRHERAAFAAQVRLWPERDFMSWRANLSVPVALDQPADKMPVLNRRVLANCSLMVLGISAVRLCYKRLTRPEHGTQELFSFFFQKPWHKRAMKRPQASKTHVLRARCDSETKSLAQRAAMILGLDESDIIRMGVRHMAGSLNNTAALLNGTR